MRKMSKLQKKLLIFLLIVLLVAIYVLIFGMNLVSKLCAEEVRAEVINIINYSNEVIQALNLFYEDYFTVHYKDDKGKVDHITANTGLVNQVNMIIQTEIQNRLNNLRRMKLSLPFGVFTGSTVLSAFGSEIFINARVIGNCYTVLSSEFKTVGINQTLHRLQINCYVEINMLIPTRSVAADVTNEILIAENVIVGDVPSTYLGENTTTDYLDLLPD